MICFIEHELFYTHLSKIAALKDLTQLEVLTIKLIVLGILIY